LKALVIGGTGPTGPHIIGGLQARGYAVTMLNRGSRNHTDVGAGVERIVGDPHFTDTLETALAGRTFDLVVATYGRIRLVADVVANKTGRLVSIGGPPSYRGFTDPHALLPTGLPFPVPEDASRVESAEESPFGYKIRETEDVLMTHHARGTLNVSHFRYPTVYGPWQVRPTTIWWVVQRCLDGRTQAVLPEAGLTMLTRGYSQNVAHAVLLAVDKPDASAGQIYNCGDEEQYSLAQWVQLVAAEMDSGLEVVSVPDAYASTAREMLQFDAPCNHQYLDLAKLRRELGYSDLIAPREAVAHTVAWLRQNPPEDDAFLARLRAQYALEDKMIEIMTRAAQALAALDHVSRPYHHAYAHPRVRGLARDHLDR
jgi:nucleoside-diphosphate-sugar epimerase